VYIRRPLSIISGSLLIRFLVIPHYSVNDNHPKFRLSIFLFSLELKLPSIRQSISNISRNHHRTEFFSVYDHWTNVAGIPQVPRMTNHPDPAQKRGVHWPSIRAATPFCCSPTFLGLLDNVTIALTAMSLMHIYAEIETVRGKRVTDVCTYPGSEFCVGKFTKFYKILNATISG
jgi:hypothetical protein